MSKRLVITVLFVVFVLPVGWERLCNWKGFRFPRPGLTGQSEPSYQSVLAGSSSGRAESPEVDDSFTDVVGNVAGKLGRNSIDTKGNGGQTPVNGGTAARTQAEIHEEICVYGVRSESIFGESMAIPETRAALRRAVEKVAQRFGDSVVVVDLDGDSMNGVEAVLYARDVYDLTDEVKDAFERISHARGADDLMSEFESQPDGSNSMSTR